MGTITLTNPVATTEITAGLHATNYSALQTLLNGNLDNANISTSAVLDATARVGVRKNSAGSTFSRRRINFIEGTGVTLTVADDSGGEEVDVTIASSAAAVTYRKTTSKAVTNTVTETDLLNGELQVAANAMGASGVVRLSMWGDWVQTSGGATVLPRFKVKLGSGPTTVLDTSTVAASSVGSSATRYGWRALVEIMNLGATNSQIINLSIQLTHNPGGGGADKIVFATGSGVWGYSTTGAASEVGNIALAQGVGTSAIDTTAAMNVLFTVINPSASTTETKLLGALAQVL